MMATSATSLTSFWLKFFKDSGILNATSTAVYATTFAENEIQKDMIIDLTREILRELGITTMGHVLAILKHAKAVHNQTLNDKIIANTNPVIETKPSTEVTRVPVNTSPMARIIEHYVKQSDYEMPPENKPAGIKMRLVSRAAQPKLSDRLGEVSTKSTSGLKVTDRLGILKPAAIKRKPNVISLKPKQLAEEVPVKRIRKVLPEEEGGYKITMPQGITPRTKQILAKQKIAAVKTKTVFERLGEGSVSSTTCVDEPKVTFLGLDAPPSKAGGPSVFLRLGGKTKAEITSTVASESQETDESVGYHGVLKKSVARVAQKPELNTKLKTRLGNQTRQIVKIERDDDKGSTSQTMSTTKRLTAVASNTSALSRLGANMNKPTTSETARRVVKKKFIKTLANGKRVIVMREVVEEIGAESQQPKVTKKTVTFGESNFHSDNISKKSVASRLGDEEEQWDY